MMFDACRPSVLALRTGSGGDVLDGRVKPTAGAQGANPSHPGHQQHQQQPQQGQVVERGPHASRPGARSSFSFGSKGKTADKKLQVGAPALLCTSLSLPDCGTVMCLCIGVAGTGMLVADNQPASCSCAAALATFAAAALQQLLVMMQQLQLLPPDAT